MADKAKLLERYANNLSNATCAEQYIGYAKRFLDRTDGLDRDDIMRYIESLRGTYKPGTVNLHFRAIRRLYAVNNLPWDFRRGEAPVIKEMDEYRPQLGFDIIEQMISRAKKGKLYPEHQTFLALSATYGLRRGEMAKIRTKDVNLRKNSIYIATLKRGRERQHLIPPEIKPIIAAHDFNQAYPLGSVSVMFKRILVHSGCRDLARMRLGWHTVRRALLTGLIDNGCPMLKAKAFLRWSSGGEESMPARYYGNVVITLKDSEPVLQTAKSDEDIFEKYHPFLEFWR